MGNLYVVATPIGNMKDITLRAIDVLGSVDFILCEDTRYSLKLLNYYNIKKPLYAYHKFNEVMVSDKYLDKILEGSNGALITDAGTPCISDPGYIIVRKAREKGINVIGIGGLSSLVLSISISGIDSKNFVFYGFVPREVKQRLELVDLIKNSEVPVFVFYESPKRIVETLKYLKEYFPKAKVAVASDLTKVHECVYYGIISEALAKLIDNPNSDLGEYTIVFDRNCEVLKKDNNMSIEALVIDMMIKDNLSLKEATKMVAKEEKLNKNEVYQKMISLKKIMGGHDE